MRISDWSSDVCSSDLESVSRTQEYAYDDWAMAHIAEAVGATADAAALRKRSQNYRNVIDPSIGFARPRFKDGSWWKEYDPSQIGHDVPKIGRAACRERVGKDV